MHCICSQIELYEVWHYRWVHNEFVYGYTIRLQPYYHVACLTRLHTDTFQSANCHSLYYKMQIHTLVHTDFIFDHQCTLPRALWSRVISAVSFSPFQNTLIAMLQPWLGLKKKSLDLNQFMSNFNFGQPSFFGGLVCSDQKNFTIDLHPLRLIWWNLLRTVWPITFCLVAKRNTLCT